MESIKTVNNTRFDMMGNVNIKTKVSLYAMQAGRKAELREPTVSLLSALCTVLHCQASKMEAHFKSLAHSKVSHYQGEVRAR